MKIELIDLRKRFQEERHEILKCINRVLKKGNLILTSEVQNFEKSICKFTGSKYCLGLNSGTDALMMSLWSAGISKGDEVITSPISFIASVSSIIHVGAKPVFVDVLPNQNRIAQVIRVEMFESRMEGQARRNPSSTAMVRRRPARSSSLSLSKIRMFASTATPTESTKPAMPGSVRVIGISLNSAKVMTEYIASASTAMAPGIR